MSFDIVDNADETGARIRTERRLAAILAADIAGYSRLIGAEEESTLQRLRSVRAEEIDPKIPTIAFAWSRPPASGWLIEFGGVVDALRCAIEVEQEMRLRNSGLARH